MKKLTDNQRDVLGMLGHSTTSGWSTPLELGGHNGSHHSGTLNALARKGLVQFKQRHEPDPPPGENGAKRWRGRGSKSYRITPAGRKALAEAGERNG